MYKAKLRAQERLTRAGRDLWPELEDHCSGSERDVGGMG